MINKIRISGFKCFDYAELELKNFTLLAGQNSAGKTTVIQSIFAMLQNGKNPFRGEYMNIGKPNELRNALTENREIVFHMYYEWLGKVKSRMKKISQIETIETSDTMEMIGEDDAGDIIDQMKVIYCSADRIGVKDTYEKYLGDDILIGKNCEYAFHYLSAHNEDRQDIDKDFIYNTQSKLTFGGQVDYWLNKIMGYRVKAREIEKTEFIQVLYMDERMPFEIRPKNVGTGVTYITEIVVAALSCNTGDLLIIENPEIHLHPSGQAELVKFLALLAQYGVQVIVETHSDHIYNGIRKSIRLDEISCENVSIYFFKQNEKGCGVPLNIPINDEGKALASSDGLFDQINKDLDVILGW